MPVTSIWTSYGSNIDWGTARALAIGWGGDLTTRLNYDHESHNFHGTAWVGVTRSNGAFYTVAGAPVIDKYQHRADPNAVYIAAGAYASPFVHPVLDQSRLDAPAGGLANQLVWDVAGTSIRGTPYADVIQPAELSGMTIDLGGGDDWIWTNRPLGSAAHISLGAGNDRFDAMEAGYIEVRDGPGNDEIDAFQGKIIAAIERGGNDLYLMPEGTVSYSAATADLSGTADRFVFSSETGTDFVEARQIVGGSGDDHLAGWAIILGSDGADWLQPLSRAEGGRGDDVLIADTTERVELRGEDGDDRFVLSSSASVSGGSGADTYLFRGTGQVTINDLQPGDVIDLSPLLPDMSVAYLRAAGYFTSALRGGYTYGYVDLTGQGDSFTELFALKGVFHDLDRFIRAPSGLVGTAGDDRLDGSAGYGEIAGLAGRDILIGGPGNDRLVGGSGADVLEGGQGSDTADYRDAPGAVRADLAAPLKNTGDSAGDTYSSIENLTGSAFADTLVGDNGNNVLSGGDGADFLAGGGDADRLLGGNGNDTLTGQGGNDWLDGGKGTDTLIGGRGSRDIFVLDGADNARDVILDFELGEDRIDISQLNSLGVGWTTIETSDAAGTLIEFIGPGPDYGNVGTVYLAGVDNFRAFYDFTPLDPYIL